VRILTRYLVARFFATFIAFLVVSSATIVIVEMMLNLGDMLKRQTGLTGIINYLSLRLPAYYLRDLVPSVAFAAAFFTFGDSARAREILATKAGGLSPRRTATPVLISAMLLSAAAFVVNETLVLQATQLWNQRDSKSNPISFRQGSFWYQRGRTIYNIGDADRATNTLRGIQIYELDDQRRLLRSIEAERATVSGEHRWNFQAPLIRRFSPTQPEEPPITERHTGELTLDLAEEPGRALMNADVTTLSLSELQQVASYQQQRSRSTARPDALLHARMSDPFTTLLFVLAAIPLGIRVEARTGQGMTLSALYGIATVAAFFSLRSLAEALTTGGLLTPAQGPWTLVVAFGGFAGWRYARMPG